MHTIWIIDHYSSEPKYGGYSRQYNFAVGLAKRGYNVVVIASSFSHFTHNYISQKKVTISKINNNVHYIYVKTGEYKFNSSIYRFKGMIEFCVRSWKNIRNIEQKFGRPLWVVGSSPHPFVWILAFQIAKKYNAKFIAEVRDFWPLELETENTNSIYKLFFGLLSRLERWAFNNANKIICTLPYGDRYICDKLKIDRDKYTWIGQPLDCKRYDILMNDKKLPVDIEKFIYKQQFICVFAGYYMKYQGVYEILSAAKEIYNDNIPISFLFVGDGEEKDNMKKYVCKNKLHNVLIYDRIDKECIPTLLSRCNVNIAILSDPKVKKMLKYGLSMNKVNEYLYSGSVTILGYFMKENEVTESGGGFSYNPHEEKLSDIIIKIYNLSELEREKIGINGRNYAIQNHGVDALVEKYIEKILLQ